MAPDPTYYCGKCRIHYPDYKKFDDHRKRKMREGDSHIHCGVCGMEFHLIETLSRHLKQSHAREQDLDCPGCSMHFTRIGSLIQHFESDQCLKIGKGEIEDARWARSKLGRGLAELNGVDSKDFFGKFLSSGRKIPDEELSSLSFHRRFLGHIDSGESMASTLGSKPKDLVASTLPVGASTMSFKAQSSHAPGPDLRPGSLDKAEFPTLVEAAAPKLKAARTLNDSRWAPKKKASASAQQSHGTMRAVAPSFEPQQQTVPLHQASLQPSSEQAKAVVARLEPHQQQTGPLLEAPLQPSSEQAKVVAALLEPQQRTGSLLQAPLQPSSGKAKVVVDQYQAIFPQAFFSRSQEVPDGRIEQSENTSIVNASTVKHSDQGTMGFAPASARGKRVSSALPPHLRGKVKVVLESTDDEVVTLGHQEEPSLPETSHSQEPIEVTHGITTSPTDLQKVIIGKYVAEAHGPTPSMITGQSTSGPAGTTTLPPHLRKGILGKPVAAPAAKPDEREYSPTPSMSTGQSTPEPADSGGEVGNVGKLDHGRDNFGVVPTIKSYAAVTKAVPPHLRGKPEPRPRSPSPTSPRSVGTQTDNGIHQTITLKPTDTSVDAVSEMDPEAEGLALGRHDPENPLFDSREYHSPILKKFKCPFDACGKSFKSMQGITGHLASDVHRRPLARFQCPHCLRHFASTTALTMHAESQGRRCEIRNTSEFRPFLDQLTAGITDVEGMHEDLTNRYVVTEEAMEKYGEEEYGAWAQQALAQQEQKQIEEKSGGFYDGKKVVW